MRYDPDLHHRRSIRLPGYDYSQPGAYFVTICTEDRECLFGEIVDGEMRWNTAGEMVCRWWQELNHKYPSVETDAAVVMPNHFHGIIVIADRGSHAGQPGQPQQTGQPRRVAPTGAPDVGATLCGRPQGDRPQGGRPPGLGDIVGWFKTMTTNEYIRGVKQNGWPPFPGRLWQRNYYEQIIRSAESLERIRAYIETNPERWALDRENPGRIGLDDFESWIYSSPTRKEARP